MRPRAGLQANAQFVPSPPDVAPRNGLAREHLKMADEVVTRFESVKLHHYWPCTVCGGHTGGVNVLNESEDGTVRVCENCLWRITIARPENENLRSSNNSIV